MSETKRRILESAIKLWGKDFSTSLDEIATDAGTSRRSLHRHYDGRSDLLESVFKFIIGAYLKQIKEIINSPIDSISKLKAFLHYDISNGSDYMVFCQLRKSEFEEMLNEDPDLSELYTIILELFETLKAESLIAEQLSTQWLELFYSSIVESSFKSIKNGVNQEECFQMAWHSLWNGIKQQ
ncbi:MAG: TetR/AcrR family transcriptional regulator [Chitinophagales bacterium]|nr:TetR/AcrR family transcriptional regulator [Chitinophagales bacterium]